MGLGDLQLSLELTRLGDLGQCGGHRDLLADLNHDLLQHTRCSRVHLEGIQKGAAQSHQCLELPDSCPPHGQLGLHVLLHLAQPLFHQLCTILQSGEPGQGNVQLVLADELLVEEPLVQLCLQSGHVALALHSREHLLLLQLSVAQLDFEIFEVGCRCVELPFRVQHIAFQDRVAQFQKDRICLDRLTRVEVDAFHPAFHCGWDPPDFGRNQRAVASYLPQHLSPFHLCRPDRIRTYDRRSPFETGHDNGHARKDCHNGNDYERIAYLPLARSILSYDIHVL